MLAYVSVIERLMFYASSVLFTSTIHSLSAYHQIAPASAAGLFIKGRAMCYHVCVTMHVQDPLLFVAGHRVPLVGFCLSLHRLRVLTNVNMIQRNKQASIIARNS